MATVDGLTKDRMLGIEGASVVSGVINGAGHLILTTHGGAEIDAGYALVAVPDASITQRGAVELATTTEASAHTDTERAVTPAGLASYDSRIDALEAEPGDKVQTITPPAESDPPSAYPVGMSIMIIFGSDGWTVATSSGTILTIHFTDDRCVQIFYRNMGGTQAAATWSRSYHTSNGGGGWTAWTQVATPSDPTTMGFTGEMRIWPAATAPSGWMLCEGGAISRTTYAALFTLIGTTYGVGDGSTTFNVPDMRGRVPVGFNTSDTEFNARGKTGGAKTHVLTSTEMPSHTHTQASHQHNVGGNGALTDGPSGTLYSIQNGSFYGFRATQVPSATPTINATGGGAAHNNIQPYNTVKYIIKL